MITKIFPKNEHFKVTMYGTSLVGLWPCVFEDNPHFKRIYRAYSIFILIFAACFTCCTWSKFFIIVTDEVLFLNELVENLCVASILVMIFVRAVMLKSEIVEKIVKNILTIEEKVYESEDEAIIKIYNSYARQSQLSNKMYIVSVYSSIILISIHPFFLDDIVKYYPSKNLTVYERPLPIKTWLPFKEQEHYVFAYVSQVIGGSVLDFLVASVDIFSFSLIIFPLGQIKILSYIFQNFEKYVSKMQREKICSSECASFLTIRECILKHKDIISYVDKLNDALRNMMIAEVIASSLQLAVCMLQLLLAEKTFENMAKPFLFVGSMLFRLTIYYWYANEITVQSSDIALSMFQNEWYDQPEEVKKMMLIIMLRCEKKIGLEIGSFSLMSLDTFTGIIKGAYSYITVVYK